MTEGALLLRTIADVRPTTTLEVGMAYGISTVFICEALAGLPHPATHIAIDPNQSTKWHGIGVRNVRVAGYADKLRFFEERSEFCLPRLVQEGTTAQVAFIDGLHHFEQCALEFFYIDRMLPVGGVVIFDDVDWPAIRTVVRLVLSRGTYHVIDHNGSNAERTTVLGRARKGVARFLPAQQLLRDVLVPDCDLGIRGSCVALKKTSAEGVKHGEFRPF